MAVWLRRKILVSTTAKLPHGNRNQVNHHAVWLFGCTSVAVSISFISPCLSLSKSLCFYISLEDDLMRLFGSERIRFVMERFGFPEDQPIALNTQREANEPQEEESTRTLSAIHIENISRRCGHPHNRCPQARVKVNPATNHGNKQKSPLSILVTEYTQTFFTITTQYKLGPPGFFLFGKLPGTTTE